MHLYVCEHAWLDEGLQTPLFAHVAGLLGRLLKTSAVHGSQCWSAGAGVRLHT